MNLSDTPLKTIVRPDRSAPSWTLARTSTTSAFPPAIPLRSTRIGPPAGRSPWGPGSSDTSSVESPRVKTGE